MLKQAQVDHYRFQHQLTGKMSCAWKHETFGAGISARTSSDQNTLTESAATSTSNSEAPFPCSRTPYTNSQGEQPGPIPLSWARAGWAGCVQQLSLSEAAGTQLPEPSEQDTEVTELCRTSNFKLGMSNWTGRRPVAVALLQRDKEERFVSQGKCPAIRSNASKGARGEETIRWRARKGSKAQ